MSSAFLLSLLLLSLLGCAIIGVDGQNAGTAVCSLINQGTPKTVYDLSGVNGQAIGIGKLTVSPYASIAFNLCTPNFQGCSGYVCGNRRDGGIDVLCTAAEKPTGSFFDNQSPQAGASFKCGSREDYSVEGIVASAKQLHRPPQPFSLSPQLR